MKNNKGFTLIELAIALGIIGLILGMVLLRGGALKGSADVTEVISIVKDLNAAIINFKNQYHYLPGDLPAANNSIGSIPTTSTCNIITSTANIGNGLIDTASEIQCVPEELMQSGLIKASIGSNSLHVLNTSNSNQITVLVAHSASNSNSAHVNISTAPLLPQNVIEITGLTCDSAMALDQKMDDGILTSGNIQASATCSSGAIVPYLDIAF
jgi:prepilin-type N-terminal cleavage/methylation domain-containing protein